MALLNIHAIPATAQGLCISNTFWRTNAWVMVLRTSIANKGDMRRTMIESCKVQRAAAVRIDTSTPSFRESERVASAMRKSNPIPTLNHVRCPWPGCPSIPL
jgi:hypothetical protein